VFLSLVFCVLLSPHANAKTFTASSCSSNDVQTAVNSATDGDTVNIPAGSCTWTSPVTWTNKNITVLGAGIGSTNITAGSGSNAAAFHIIITNGTSGASSAGTPIKQVSWRLSGMSISGTLTSGNSVILVDSSSYTFPVYGWRIDNLAINYSNSYADFIGVLGISWGLIDHCRFSGSSKSGNAVIVIEVQAYYNSEWNSTSGAAWEGNTSWGMPLNLGSNEAVYVEDCTFNFTGLTAAADLGHGGSAVFRHNIGTGVYFQSHGTQSGNIGRGGKKFEMYNNALAGEGSTVVIWPFVIQETGAGVIFNNSVSGFSGTNGFTLSEYRATGDDSSASGYYGVCTGSSATGCAAGCVAQDDGMLEASGWPCLGQAGRGPAVASGWSSIIASGGVLNTLRQAQPSVPVLTWNNGPQPTCFTGGPCDGSLGIVLNGGAKPLNTGYALTNYISATPHVNGDVDYCNGGTTMPKTCGNYTNNYAPYTYPHPLESGSNPAVPIPGGLHVVQ
jgi:hypothetical protein